MRFEAGINTVAAAAGAAYAELRAPSGAPITVLELGFFVQAATASSVGIGRPAAIGVTPGGATTPLSTAKASGVTSSSSFATTWGTAPTVPAAFFRRVTTPANIGAGGVFQWRYGDLVIPAGGSLVLWNFGAAAGSILSAYCAIDEL